MNFMNIHIGFLRWLARIESKTVLTVAKDIRRVDDDADCYWLIDYREWRFKLTTLGEVTEMRRGIVLGNVHDSYETVKRSPSLSQVKDALIKDALEAMEVAS